MNRVEQKWTEFKTGVLDDFLPDNDAAEGFKLCFYSGAMAMHSLLFDNPPAKDARRAYMQGILAELADYARHITQEPSPGASASGGSADLHNQPPANHPSTSNEPQA